MRRWLFFIVVFFQLYSSCLIDDTETLVLPKTEFDDLIDCNEVTTSGGYGVFINEHFLGAYSGIIEIEYDMFNVPDKLEVYYKDTLITSTDGFVSGAGSVYFYYDGKDAYSYKVRVTGNSSGTYWEYIAHCPRR